MTTRIKLRRDTAANWDTANPVLALGEPGYDTTNNKLKIGDGVTAWQDLDYLTDETGGGGSLSVGNGTDPSINNVTEILINGTITEIEPGLVGVSVSANTGQINFDGTDIYAPNNEVVRMYAQDDTDTPRASLTLDPGDGYPVATLKTLYPNNATFSSDAWEGTAQWISNGGGGRIDFTSQVLLDFLYNTLIQCDNITIEVNGQNAGAYYGANTGPGYVQFNVENPPVESPDTVTEIRFNYNEVGKIYLDHNEGTMEINGGTGLSLSLKSQQSIQIESSGSSANLKGDDYAQIEAGDAYVWVENNSAFIEVGDGQGGSSTFQFDHNNGSPKINFPNNSSIQSRQEEGLILWQPEEGGDENDAEYVGLWYGGEVGNSDSPNVSITAGSYNWATDDGSNYLNGGEGGTLEYTNYENTFANQGPRQINLDIVTQDGGAILNWHFDESGNLYLPADPGVVGTSGIVFGDGTVQTTAGGNSTNLTDAGDLVVTAGSTEHWIATQRRDNYDTYQVALRYDGLGNLYSLTESNSDEGTVVIITKYTAAGAISWQKTITNRGALNLAVDSSNCAFVVTQFGTEFQVIKFNTNGTISWKQNYAYSNGSFEEVFIEEKSTGNMILAVNANSNPTEVLLLEISGTDGSVVTKKVLQRDGENIYANGIDVVDDDDTVYITGHYYDSVATKNKMFIEKMDSTLTRVWSKSLETDTSYDMSGGDCASDAVGNVYAVGFYNVDNINWGNGNTNSSVAILTKLNSSGTVQWTRRIGPGPCGSVIGGLTVDSNGYIYLTSYTIQLNRDPSFEGNDFDQFGYSDSRMIVARYNATGAVTWQRYVNLVHLWEESNSNTAQTISVFEDKFAVGGFGYSSNTTPFNFSGTADYESDFFVVQLPTDGTELTIGDLEFTASRVPGRFVTHVATDISASNVLDTTDNTVTVTTPTITPDVEARVANSLVKSDAYDYTFGADGTLTIPNDGDLKLTQSQIGYLVAIGGSVNDNANSWGRAVTVDSQGNMYVAGEDDGNSQPFVVKISPEGDKLWGVIIQEGGNGNNGRANGITLNPVTGNVMVVCEFYSLYTYSSLVTIDQDTGRILTNQAWYDDNTDVYLNDVAYTSTGNVVVAGSKNGEFSPEQSITAEVGSTTGNLIVLRSNVAGTPIQGTWQIGGTGIDPFENIQYIERYTGLTSTVRQGSGAEFIINDNGDGTYANATSITPTGSNYVVGHKIKVLGTSLGGATPANDAILTVSEVVDGAITAYTIEGTAAGIVVTPWAGVTGTNYNVGSGATFYYRQDPSQSSYTNYDNAPENGGSNYVDYDVITISGDQLGGLANVPSISGATINGYDVPSSRLDFPDPSNPTLLAALTNGRTWTVNGGVLTNATVTNAVLNGSVIEVTVSGDLSGTSLADSYTFTTPGNDLTAVVSASGGQINGFRSVSGTAQSTTWKIQTTTQVDFSQPGSWSLTYPLSRENFIATPTWQRTFGTYAGDQTDRLYALAIDSSDNIIVVGQGYGNIIGGSYDLATVWLYTSAGSDEWVKQLNEVNDGCRAMSVTTLGTDIYVTHYSYNNNETVISKLDTSGNIKWQRKTYSSDDSVIARTPDGNLLVAVEAYNDDINDNALKIFKMTPSGEPVYKRWLFATTDSDTNFKNGRSLITDATSFYITGYFYANNYDSALAARLPLDGSGTGEYGSFRYTDVNAMDGSFNESGLTDINYNVELIDSTASFAGDIAGEAHGTTTTTVDNDISDFYVDWYSPVWIVETVRDTDGGRIVFADGTTQNTSATDTPQRRYTGQKYTLGLADRGHHILCNNSNDEILIPYNARVEFPIGTTITIVNMSYGSVYIYTEGGGTSLMIAGNAFNGFNNSAQIYGNGVGTLLKVGRESWVLYGTVDSY